MTLAERIAEHASEFTKKVRGRGAGYRKHDEKSWRMSSLGRCARQQAYSYLGTAPDEEYRSDTKTMSLEDGHLHEGEIIARICALPNMKLVAENKPCKRKLKTKSGLEMIWAGTPDLELKDNGEPVIVEIKALQDYAFSELKKSGEPSAEYVTQLRGYMIIKKAKRGILVVKSRNTSEILSFDYEWDSAEMKALMRRQAKIQSLVNKGKLPNREYSLGDRACFYCAYSKQCWPGKEFKGYIHEGDKKAGVSIDLDDEPEHKSKFITAVKLFEKAKNAAEVAEAEKVLAKDRLEQLLTKFKAHKIAANGYSAFRVINKDSEEPDRQIIKELVASGKIPTKVKPGASYVRVSLPKKKKENNDD